MVSRLIAIGLMPLLGMACSSVPERLPPADTLVNSGIRQQQVHSVLGRNVRVERPADVALAEAVFTPLPAEAPRPVTPAALPGVRVFAGRTVSLELAIDAYAKTTGMRAVFDQSVNTDAVVTVPHEIVAGEELVAVLEGQTNVIIHAYPYARMLLVLPEIP